jgi:3-oxoacyl-[acyl-carrier protein] reductase
MNLTYDAGVALVAGGTGGIGAAVARELCASDVPVALTFCRNEAGARTLAESLGAGATAHHWAGGGFADAGELLRRIRDERGAVRFVVSCSGLAQQAAFHALSEAAARQLVEVNLVGPLALVRAALVPMMKEGAGRVLLVGSVSGSRGFPGHTVYAATKAGLAGLTRALAREAGRFGVTVNCIEPGFIETPMTASVPPRVRRAWLERVPLERPGRPEEVAQLVAFVLSRQAGYLTGQTLVLDGGLSA